MSGRSLRCAACSRRIRDHHPHIGIEDHASGREVAYHARPECQERGADHMAAMIERGKVYVLHHHHVCGDAVPGFDCSGGCFSGSVALGRN